MEMREVSKLMEQYFNTVTPEQFEQDMIEAGILDCPLRVSFSLQSDSTKFAVSKFSIDTIIVDNVVQQTDKTWYIDLPTPSTHYILKNSESDYIIKDVA